MEQRVEVSYGTPHERKLLSFAAIPEVGPGGEVAAISVVASDRQDAAIAGPGEGQPCAGDNGPRTILLETQIQRRRAQQEVERLTMILDNLAAGVTVADASKQVVFRNRRALEIAGAESRLTSLLGDSHGAAVLSLNGERPPVGSLPVARLLRGEKVENEEHILQRPDGSRRRVLASGSLVTTDSGPFAIVSFQDMTRLDELESRREEYVQILSHDLRAPLTVIAAGAQMIMMQSKDEHLTRQAQAVLAAGHRIACMIDDLVVSASVEYKGVRLDLAPADVMVLLANLLVEFREAMDTSRVRLSCSCPHPWVPADKRHLNRVFVNLIANALQYSGPDSPVEVSVGEAEGLLVISVADKGPGIAPDELPRLFQRHFRGEAVRDTTQGMGLGLYVVRGLVEAHGGRVWVESTLGQGSTFYVSLPALAAPDTSGS